MCIFYFHFDLQLKNDKKLFELRQMWKTWNPPAASALWRLIKLLRRCSYQDVNLQNVCTCTKCTYICHNVSYMHTWQYGRLRYRLNYWRNLWIIFIQAGLKLKIIIVNSEYSPVLFFHNSYILKVRKLTLIIKLIIQLLRDRMNLEEGSATRLSGVKTNSVQKLFLEQFRQRTPFLYGHFKLFKSIFYPKKINYQNFWYYWYYFVFNRPSLSLYLSFALKINPKKLKL